METERADPSERLASALAAQDRRDAFVKEQHYRGIRNQQGGESADYLERRLVVPQLSESGNHERIVGVIQVGTMSAHNFDDPGGAGTLCTQMRVGCARCKSWLIASGADTRDVSQLIIHLFFPFFRVDPTCVRRSDRREAPMRHGGR
jgi:hypothetical protein